MAFDLAAHIRRTREELGLTQTELAKRAGIHQGDLSRIERGECDPRWSTVQRLSAALGEIVGPATDADRQTRRRLHCLRARRRRVLHKRGGDPHTDAQGRGLGTTMLASLLAALAEEQPHAGGS